MTYSNLASNLQQTGSGPHPAVLHDSQSAKSNLVNNLRLMKNKERSTMEISITGKPSMLKPN